MIQDLQSLNNKYGTIKVLVDTVHPAQGRTSSSGFEDVGGLDKAGEILRSATDKTVEVGIGAFMECIDEIANGFQIKMDELSQKTTMNEATLEFGLTADIEGNVYLFKLGSDINLNVSLKWSSNSAEIK